MKMLTQDIVNKLRNASDAYYNTGKPIMTDDEYDELRDELIKREPNHPFLNEVGAKPTAGSVKLPFIMASLNKIKPATGAVEAFAKKSKKRAWVFSEKLDGISALWYSGHLYLRGDGLNGVDITPFAKYILGLIETPYAVRGELVVQRGVIQGTLARSWVNGQLHQKVPIPEELKKVRFVAYEIMNANMASWDQFLELKKIGFEIPWRVLANEQHMNDAMLGKFLVDRREKSLYDTDGIVVCENINMTQTGQENTVKNPSHKMAFKMLLNDQCAETMILEIEWNASAQGFLIPRIRVEPVIVGTARIEYVTGHNARFIVDNKLGVGAKIMIRRSGDVIPAVEKVLVSSPGPWLPNQDVLKWKWVNNDTTAAHIMLAEETPNKEIYAARLVIFAKTLDIAGLGPGVASKLVDGGIETPGKLWKASVESLVTAVGKANGAKLYAQLKELNGKCTEIQLMVASSLLPRGVGETKLAILFEKQSDPRKWNTLPVLQGWSEDSLNELKASMPKYESWRTKEITHIPYPILNTPKAEAPVKDIKGTVCFTGVRSKELETLLQSAGWKIVDSVSSKLNVLIVPDGESSSETGKAKKARDLGTVRILELSAVKSSLGIGL